MGIGFEMLDGMNVWSDRQVVGQLCGDGGCSLEGTKTTLYSLVDKSYNY
jgi:hypothetical protein